MESTELNKLWQRKEDYLKNNEIDIIKQKKNYKLNNENVNDKDGNLLQVNLYKHIFVN